MKFFAVFAVLVAVAAADFSSWTLPQLSDAIQNPETDPAIMPALEQALNDMMDSLFAQPIVVPADVAAPVDLTGWTLHDISSALQNPTTDPALIPYLEQALNEMMDAIHAGIPVEAIGVPVIPTEVSYWTLQELSEALQDPTTDPALVPYLEHALNDMIAALFGGNQLEVIAIVAPAGLAKPELVEILPTPVVIAPSPVEEAPTPVEVAPSPIVPPTASTGNPLVQIIINIQNQA